MIAVRVPASSANLGPGFDALGMAIALHAEVGLVDASTGSAERSKQVDEHHPASIAFAAAGGKGTLWVRSPIPIGRGLGFSGAMRVGGAAVAMIQRVGDRALVDRHADVLGVAAGLEGHADNVAASLYGGIVATDGTTAVRRGHAAAARRRAVDPRGDDLDERLAHRAARRRAVRRRSVQRRSHGDAGCRPRRRRRRRPGGGDAGPPAPGPPVPHGRRRPAPRSLRDSLPAPGADGCREAARRWRSSPRPGRATWSARRCPPAATPVSWPSTGTARVVDD